MPTTLQETVGTVRRGLRVTRGGRLGRCAASVPVILLCVALLGCGSLTGGSPDEPGPSTTGGTPTAATETPTTAQPPVLRDLLLDPSGFGSATNPSLEALTDGGPLIDQAVSLTIDFVKRSHPEA